MHARFTFRLISGDRTIEVNSMAVMPVDPAVVLPHGLKTIADLVLRAGPSCQIDPRVLEAALECITTSIINQNTQWASSTALLTGGWLIVGRLDKRDDSRADEPYLPMAMAA